MENKYIEIFNVKGFNNFIIGEINAELENTIILDNFRSLSSSDNVSFYIAGFIFELSKPIILYKSSIKSRIEAPDKLKEKYLEFIQQYNNYFEELK